MAAIVPNVERTRDPEEQIDAEAEAHASAPLAGVGAFGIMQDVPVLQSSHAELTRTVWIRRTLEDVLARQKYWIERRSGAKAEDGEEAPEEEGVALAGLPVGVKLKKDPDFDYNGEWIFTYQGQVCRFHFSPELPRGWNMIRPRPWAGPRDDFGSDLIFFPGRRRMADNKAQAVEALKALIDTQDPWIQPYLRPAAGALGGVRSEKAKALARIKRLVARAEKHPEEEIDGVPLPQYLDNEVALFHEEYNEAPDLRFGDLADTEEYTGPVDHSVQIVAGDRLPGRDAETVEGLGAPSGSDQREKGGEWIFRLTPGIPADTIPWYIGAIPLVDTCSFFGSNGKMKCPTWDLPAGAPHTGGTCPGAIGAQSVVEPKERLRVLEEEGGRFYLPVIQPGGGRVEVEENRAICQMCYALEGNYPAPHVQIGEMVRYWWTRDMLASGRREEWIKIMVSAVLALRIEESNGIEPIRVHSSGDFYSQSYAAAWMEVANRVATPRPKIRFWAPTRTWAVGWDWEKILALNTAGNFVVRPSSYGVGDVAPGELAPGRGAGSTSILNPDNLGMTQEREAIIVAGRRKQYEHNRAESQRQGPDRRYDWDCQTYAVALSGKGDLSKSCADATGPEGHQGCRACWTHPNLRINYTTH